MTCPAARSNRHSSESMFLEVVDLIEVNADIGLAFKIRCQFGFFTKIKKNI